MTRTRREFLQNSAAALAGSCLATQGLSAAAAAGEAGTSKCLDYARSFICGTASFNQVRFWVESRTTVYDDQAGTATDYYQCASCKSENTFGEKDLFLADNYDFLPILGGGHWLVFRRRARISLNYRTVCTTEKLWGEPRLLLHDAEQVQILDSFEQIRDATAAGLPLVTQTEIRNEQTGLRAIIECPTKTMNVSLDKGLYQVDTGPIAYPDLSKRFDPQIDCLSVAFVAFNAPHFADLIVEQPTALVEDGQTKGMFYHFSAPFSLPAKNTVLALGALSDASSVRA
ncbi:MAG: hypothetical protein GX575_27910 [Candidatus Anammoximicrobium sp.]|nr:hypothetical protein [Candidatus Anammoximicrobium sp.]